MQHTENTQEEWVGFILHWCWAGVIEHIEKGGNKSLSQKYKWKVPILANFIIALAYGSWFCPFYSSIFLICSKNYLVLVYTSFSLIVFKFNSVEQRFGLWLKTYPVNIWYLAAFFNIFIFISHCKIINGMKKYENYWLALHSFYKYTNT